METKRHFSAEVAARLADIFSLDELEIKILSEAKGETAREIAKELGALLLPTEARIARSIPIKLNVKTLVEARIKLQIAEKKGSYAPREDRFIIKNCKKMSYREMALQLGRSTESIRQRMEILKRLRKIKRSGFVKDGVFHPYYSEEQNRVIIKRYPDQDIKLLTGELKRSEASLRYRAAKLKTKRMPPAYLNVIKIVRLLRVTQQTVVHWLNQGFLRGSKSGRGVGQYQEWRIEPQDFYDFVKDYYYLYEPKLVRDKFLRSIIKSTPAGRAVPVCQAVKVLGISKAEIQRRIKSGELQAYKSFAGYHRFKGFRWFVLVRRVRSRRLSPAGNK